MTAITNRIKPGSKWDRDMKFYSRLHETNRYYKALNPSIFEELHNTLADIKQQHDFYRGRFNITGALYSAKTTPEMDEWYAENVAPLQEKKRRLTKMAYCDHENTDLLTDDYEICFDCQATNYGHGWVYRVHSYTLPLTTVEA